MKVELWAIYYKGYPESNGLIEYTIRKSPEGAWAARMEPVLDGSTIETLKEIGYTCEKVEVRKICLTELTARTVAGRVRIAIEC